MFIEQTRTVGEISLNVAEGPPHGLPSVLLHGVLRSWMDLTPVFPVLAPRGHGKSGRAAGQYWVANYIPDVVALLDQLSASAVVYGHYLLGAVVVLGAVAAAPDRVVGLVLEDPPFHTMGRDIFGTAFHSQFTGLTRIGRPGGSVNEFWNDLRELPIAMPGRTEATLRATLSFLESLRPS